MKKIKILAAEDDEHIRTGLRDALSSEGYEVVEAADGFQALEVFDREKPDLLLLDIMMPGKSGFDACREIRRKNRETPIIMLTAKGEEIDKVLGLELGADDYVTKPFGVRELLARISAVLRRTGVKDKEQKSDPELPEIFKIGEALIDRKKFEVCLGSKKSSLSAREVKLLELFYSRPGEVLSRNDLLNQAWGIDYFGTTRTLDQHIAQLRKKIEPDISSPTVITTVHGVGYRYQALDGE